MAAPRPQRCRRSLPVLALALVFVGASRPFPAVQRSSAVQRGVLSELRRAAEAASAAATPRLLERLGSEDFRAHLAACCGRSGVAAWSAERLLEHIRANLYAAELVHNFDGNGHRGINLDILLNNATEYFPNSWELLLLGYMGEPSNATYGHPSSPTDAAEEGIFRLPPFRGEHDLPKSFDEASSRLQYVALNALRLDVGNPMFGQVAAVFSASYWVDAVAIAPTDTGMYTTCCNETYRSTPGRLELPCEKTFSPLECHSGQPVPGVSGAMDHVILNNHLFWGRANRLGRLFESWHGDEIITVSLNETMSFMESNILGGILYAERGLKLLVGSFAPLFGTARGALLRDFAAAHGIALAWAFGAGMAVLSDFQKIRELTWRPDVRLLDPSSVEGGLVNASAADSRLDAFQDVWADAAAVHAASAGAEVPQSELQALWRAAKAALAPAMQLGLPVAGECADWHACLGVSGVGDCVCYRADASSLIVA